jgi:CubicO group peptidase (beta-lactamase class C family)
LLLYHPLRAAIAEVKLPVTLDPKAIDAFLTAEVKKRGRVGLSAAIVKDGKLVLARGYGMRSLEDSLPVETTTLFAIGSVTKQFTCAAVMLLAEEGKLSVQDKVEKYFPKLTSAHDITLLDLMNHTSGYPDYYPLDFVDRRMLKPATADEVIMRYATGKLDFEPGTKWSYSNTGFLILGQVVEQVSGQSFGPFLQARIFTPLGMEHTVYSPKPSDRRLAKGYTAFALSRPEAVAPEAEGWAGAAGAIYSTPSDLATWDLALMGGKVLKPESYKLMTMSRKLPDGKITEYGCGLGTRVQDKRQVLTHSGAVSGFNAWNGMVPSTQSAVIIFANNDGGLGGLPGQLLGLVLKEATNVPKIDGPSTSEAVRSLFVELQRGNPNRSHLAEEFNWFLTPEKVSASAKRLKPFGSPTKLEVLQTSERGGMEVSLTRLTFKSGALKAQMYRRPDGIIEQFFVLED